MHLCWQNGTCYLPPHAVLITGEGPDLNTYKASGLAQGQTSIQHCSFSALTLVRLCLAGLENDEYVRQIDGYLPTAEVAFVDEIFKANSAILNALLTLLNERLFDNGNQRLPVPLLCLVSSPCRLYMPGILCQQLRSCPQWADLCYCINRTV